MSACTLVEFHPEELAREPLPVMPKLRRKYRKKPISKNGGVKRKSSNSGTLTSSRRGRAKSRMPR